jgi:hypothetical protein
MARRAQSKIGLPLIALMIGLPLAAVGVLWQLTKGGSSIGQPLGNLSEISIADYRTNANSLRGNQYKVSGRIIERFDQWRASEGAWYRLDVEQDNTIYPFPVHFPPALNELNIEVGQTYLLKIEIADQGIARVLEAYNE